MSNLLIETMDTSLTETRIVENENGERDYYISGIFMQSEVVNGNGRIYPKQVMKRECDRYIEQYINKGRGAGELEHPESGRSDAINLRYVSHKIIELREEGNNWVGKALITKNTATGGTVKGLLDAGIVLGVSSRARGSVKKSGNVNVVQNDFRLITPADIVYEPSAPDALVTAIMEGQQWVYENGVLTEREIEDVQAYVNKNIREQARNKAIVEHMFQKIMSDIKSKGA